ncbi:SMP-30/gluconolactonase/LRE family protein [Sphingobium nicotianae]|uniref:SMP-30/gluconolactonase/LRE family protein n=1 Tax=Sphingobium nicotianae TaxID=2782607 RepID=A0A9X1ISL1_9SPHN|nr:SMP-30/gluconolactonase/LRE family protein [Sphingobium nicotianae]MBT2188701.1 SMP-30/gluconolactonase/LRE family protein [Sphingobium nicotianae]
MTRPVSIALDARASLGEGPRWHGGEQRLYWVDIDARELHRFDPATGTDEVRRFDQPVACFAFRKAGGLILAMKDGLALLEDWDGTPVPFGNQIFAGKCDIRFNDGRTDPAGRFWVGSVNMTKSARDAALYRVDPDGTISWVEGDMLTCNGAAFNAEGTVFRHADTPSHALRGYDVDPVAGTLSGRRIVHQFEQGKGRPDGGSFDAEGCYWSALFDGGRVVRLSPEGEILQTVTLPASRPTMIAFGGADLRTAYVTTARSGLSDADLAAQPHAGALFSFPVAVPGLPEPPFAG